MSTILAAILGGAAGAVALVGMVITVIWFCLFHNRSAGRTSETGSSDPSVQGNFISRAGAELGFHCLRCHLVSPLLIPSMLFWWNTISSVQCNKTIT